MSHLFVLVIIDIFSYLQHSEHLLQHYCAWMSRNISYRNIIKTWMKIERLTKKESLSV